MPETRTEPCQSCGSQLDVTGAPLFASRTCPICGDRIRVHREFGHYELLGVIGQGGQGTVYRATDRNLNRQVALKVLHVDQGSDVAFAKQFEHEAHLTASINHPHVVRVFSFGTEDGYVFIAMELVDGGTMDDLMEKLGRVPEARVLQIGIQVAEGLRAGFEKGLIHRDVKPGNILFDSEDSAKVVDFGLAVFQEQQAAATGDIWGTPYYLSPERLNRVDEDFRSDIYSLGASLFHAIAGRPPFEAEDASHVALKHLRTQAVSIQAFAPDVTNATAYVINRTLAKNRDERPASYGEFIEQLQYARQEALARAAAGGRPAARSRVVLEDASDKRTMNWLTLAMFVVLVLGVAVGGWLAVKGLRGGGYGDTVDGEAKVAKLDEFGPGWGEAKQLLLAGKWPQASEAFGALAAKSAAGSRQADWATIHKALAEQFDNGGDAAQKVLAKLPDSATQLRKFFRDQIRSKLAGTEPIRAADAAGFNPANHEVLGALFLALRSYELGDIENAGALFSQFTSLAPDSAVAWLSEYGILAKPYQDQFVTFNLAADAWKNARNEHERIQALAALRALPGRLAKGGKFAARARKLLDEADRQFNTTWAEKNKGNFAFRAKATGSNKNDTPEKAVDGDPSTAWSATGPGQKWLAVDLGAPRNLSRWVLRTGSVEGGKLDQNLSGFKLQRSDDGQNWTDIDTVQDNRAGTIDRIVPPFTARHVRVFVTKESGKPADKTARIHELMLGAAADQAKAAYEPGESVAVRFSLKTDFLSGPVGETGAAGSAQFSEADGKFTIQGGGGVPPKPQDAFHFVWQPVAGDCELVARVSSPQQGGSPMKVGVAIRSDLAREASHAGLYSVPGKKLQFNSRAAPGKPGTEKEKADASLPRWLKLVRHGADVIGYDSDDGRKWTETGRETLTGMRDVAHVGLVVRSQDKDKLVTAQFSDVRIQKTKP